MMVDRDIEAAMRDGTNLRATASGQVGKIKVDLLAAVNPFRVRRQIRLEVGASDWPRFGANPQSGGASGAGSTPGVTRHTVHHAAAHPPRLILPVVPRD